MVLDPRKSGRVWVEPASRRVLAGREGMGRPPRRFPRAQRSFLYPATPRSDHQPERRGQWTRWTISLHLQRDMTPSTHIEACMTMSVRRRSATRTALVTSALVTSALVTYGLEDPIWYGRRQGGGGVWHRPSQRASSRSGGVWYSTRQGSSTIPNGAKSGTLEVSPPQAELRGGARGWPTSWT